jgi:hypothetical protein
MPEDSKYHIGPDVDLEAEDVRLSDGTRLTPEVADEIAERAMQRVYTRRGRPSLTGGRKHSPRVSYRVPEPLADKLAAEAERTGKTPSQIGREALEKYLESA